MCDRVEDGGVERSERKEPVVLTNLSSKVGGLYMYFPLPKRERELAAILGPINFLTAVKKNWQCLKISTEWLECLKIRTVWLFDSY